MNADRFTAAFCRDTTLPSLDAFDPNSSLSNEFNWNFTSFDPVTHSNQTSPNPTGDKSTMSSSNNGNGLKMSV